MSWMYRVGACAWLVVAPVTAPCAAQTVSAPLTFVEAPADAPSSLPTPARWWSIFGDAQLDLLIERGMRDSPDLAAAAARLAIARAAIRETASDAKPRLSAIAGVAEQTGALATATGDNGSLFELGARASWEPDLFGRVGKATRAARLDARAAAADAEAVRLALQADIATTYFALRSLDEEAALLASAEADAHDEAAILARQNANGTLGDSDLARRQAALTDGAAARIALDRRRAGIRHALAALIGAESLPSLASAAAPTVPDVPAGLPSTMLARRPDVAAAIDHVEAARLRHRAARSAWFPSFDLTANGGQASTTLGDLLRETAQTFGFNLILSLPIFDGGRSAARTGRAAAEADLALAEQRATIVTAFREVEDALAETRLSRDAEANARRAADAAASIAAIAARREAAGAVSRLDLLAARQPDLAARQRLIAARQARVIAAVALIRALGGGWGDAPPRPALDLAANDRH